MAFVCNQSIPRHKSSLLQSIFSFRSVSSLLRLMGLPCQFIWAIYLHLAPLARFIWPTRVFFFASNLANCDVLSFLRNLSAPWRSSHNWHPADPAAGTGWKLWCGSESQHSQHSILQSETQAVFSEFSTALVHVNTTTNPKIFHRVHHFPTPNNGFLQSYFHTKCPFKSKIWPPHKNCFKAVLHLSCKATLPTI